jgi:hypothetical protein
MNAGIQRSSVFVVVSSMSQKVKVFYFFYMVKGPAADATDAPSLKAFCATL